MDDAERITLSMQRAAAAVPRSSAECLQRDFWEWRLRPSDMKRDIAAMADDLRADLDQLFLQARQRPLLDRLRRRQRAQKIAEIVGQRKQMETEGVGHERSAQQPRPIDHAFFFF
jgi:hypothetical protein